MTFEIEGSASAMRGADFRFSSSIDGGRGMTSPGAITSLLKKLSRQIRRGRRVLELCSNMGRHLRVSRALAKEEYREIRRLQRKIWFKYLNRRYLVLGITTNARASALEHHYRFMKLRFSDRYLKHQLVSGLRLWGQEDPQGCHELFLTFSHPCDNEGELTIFYKFADVSIARASFTFVPAGLVGEETHSALLLTRLQSEKNVHEHIRAARKSLHGLDGPTTIVACLAGIAQTLGLHSLTVVTAEAQVSRTEMNLGTLVAAYDEFFRSLGAEEANGNFIKVSLPLPEKPLGEVKSSNRKKVAIQRMTKGYIMASTVEECKKSILRMHEERSE